MKRASTPSGIDWSGRHFIQARPHRRRAKGLRQKLLIITALVLLVGVVAGLAGPVSSTACFL